jgi:hypothetical protein
MSENLSADEREEIVNGLSRSQRLLLKRAFAKTRNKPLRMQGPNMQVVAAGMAELGYAEWVSVSPPELVLTKKGFQLANYLSVKGWPNCERKR